MKEKERLEKLNALIVPSKSNWMEKIAWREENRDWLKLSGRIAARALTVMKAHKITQVQLAKAMGVSPQYVNKMLKGNEKFQIDTICKLERCLGVKLLEVPKATGLEYETEAVETETVSFEFSFFEKQLFDSVKVAEDLPPYRVAKTKRTRSVGASKRIYRKRPTECKVIEMNVNLELAV